MGGIGGEGNLEDIFCATEHDGAEKGTKTVECKRDIPSFCLFSNTFSPVRPVLKGRDAKELDEGVDIVHGILVWRPC
jgi:hypothetical protein